MCNFFQNIPAISRRSEKFHNAVPTPWKRGRVCQECLTLDGPATCLYSVRYVHYTTVCVSVSIQMQSGHVRIRRGCTHSIQYNTIRVYTCCAAFKPMSLIQIQFVLNSSFMHFYTDIKHVYTLVCILYAVLHWAACSLQLHVPTINTFDYNYKLQICNELTTQLLPILIWQYLWIRGKHSNWCEGGQIVGLFHLHKDVLSLYRFTIGSIL
jgi:hypothetical protein